MKFDIRHFDIPDNEAVGEIKHRVFKGLRVLVNRFYPHFTHFERTNYMTG